MSILKYSIGCVALSTMLLACSKDKKYDVRGDKEVKFFVNVTALGDAPQNSVSFNVANRPESSGNGLVNISHNLPETIKIPVFATREVSEDVTITAQLDNSLIAGYNAAHDGSFEAFPDGFLNASNLTARITKGMTYSVDSLTIAVNQAAVTSLSGKAYLAPIRLTAVSKPAVGSITSTEGSQVVYVVIKPELRMIQYNAVAADMTGTLINPRSGWELIFNPAPIQTGNALDGSTSTYTRWGVSNVEITANLNETRAINGIRVFTVNSSTYNPLGYSVYTSTDGVNYDLIGAPLRANITFASGYSYIKFYKAIDARFVRLVINYTTSTNANNRRLAEFDLYGN